VAPLEQPHALLMKIATWNINGIRSGQEKLKEFLVKYSPDVLCLQEVKLDPGKRDEIDISNYQEFYYHAEKKGYSGTAIFAKEEIELIRKGLGVQEYDREARVQVVKMHGLYIVNMYFPHSRRDLSRIDFKLDFNRNIAKFIKQFPKDQTILCGDFNVAHKEIDLARPKDNKKNAGFTSVERKFMNELLSDGWIDVFRQKNPSQQVFTWWSNMRNARERNIGWRIDYFLVSPKMFISVLDCRILTEIYGSDHCPVMLTLK